MTRVLKRFFISLSLAPQMDVESKISTVLLPREETHHLKNVLRMKEGELCLLFDSEGYEFVSRIERYRDDSSTELKLIESISKNRGEVTSPLRLTVAQAIPQDRKMDEIVRQAAELGVYEIIPLITERTIVRIHKDKSAQVVERWQRIADQTLKQSRLSRAPRILQSATFDALCGNLKSYRNAFILDTSPDAKPIRNVVRAGFKPALTSGGVVKILLVIGPEGGFSQDEIQNAEHLGAKRVSLGGGILKTDTAFVAATAFLKFMNL